MSFLVALFNGIVAQKGRLSRQLFSPSLLTVCRPAMWIAQVGMLSVLAILSLIATAQRRPLLSCTRLVLVLTDQNPVEW